MTRLGFCRPDEEDGPQKVTLIRCDECQDLTIEGVLPVLVNTAGQVSQRTTVEKWLCRKCLKRAGIPIESKGKVKEEGCDDPNCEFDHEAKASRIRCFLARVRAVYRGTRGRFVAPQ